MLKNEVTELLKQLNQAKHASVLTGAGISVASQIPDLEMLHNVFNVFSESNLENHPQNFYQVFHQNFIDPIFKYGPSKSHRVLASLEQAGKIDGIVTTNVDYLHRIAGSQNVMPIWSDFNTNHCINCGRTYDINILKPALPRCPHCGGLISPDPVFRHIATLPNEIIKADQLMANSDLTIVVGSNGYYSNTSDQRIININPQPNIFDRTADLVLRYPADTVFSELEALMSN